MRKLFLSGLSLVAVLYVLPSVLGLFGIGKERVPEFQDATVPEALAVGGQSTSSADRQTGSGAQAAADVSSITVLLDGTPTSLPLETYVSGVVSAEVSDDFPTEALRAQAVAARTYAAYKVSRGRPDTHPDADVCDDYHHCAAYRDAAQQTANGQPSRSAQAVADTAGEILTYEGEPIVAVFHCASGPRTEAAGDVWGADVPYLQSVVSPGGSACDKYEDSIHLSAAQFREKAATSLPSADLSGAPDTWFKNSVRTQGGGIKTVELGGVSIEGTAVRTLFDLRSTNFTVTTTQDSLTFHTIGYGHGVGLSQYGAKYMAEQGAKYDEILSHYYQNTELTRV